MPRKKTTGRRDNKTGAIYKDGDGYRARVLLRYDTNTGKPIYKKIRTKTHEDAVAALAKLQHGNRTQTLAAPTGLTLGRYLDDWLENHVKPFRAPKTYAQYKWVLETHVIPTLGKTRLEHVTRKDVQTLVNNLAKQTVKPKSKPKPPKEGEEPKEEAKPLRKLGRRTLEVVVARLRTAYEDAMRDGLAMVNPATHISLPAAPRKPAAFLTPEQVQKLNKALEGSPIKDLIRFMLATGARIGEATGVRWVDLDLEKRFVRIAGQLQRVEKKLVYLPTTKTNQDRTLPLPAWLAESLKVLQSGDIVDAPDPDGIVFLNEYGRRFDQRYVGLKLAEACAKAEIPVVSPHKLRHTAATIALMETGDLHSVQMMLGHQQVALTANLYGHAIAEGLRPTLDALGKSVRPPEVKGEERE